MTATRAWRGTLHAILAAAGERRWAVHTSPTTRSPTATRSRDLSMLRPRIPIKKSVSRPRSESRWKAQARQYLVELTVGRVSSEAETHADLLRIAGFVPPHASLPLANLPGCRRSGNFGQVRAPHPLSGATRVENQNHDNEENGSERHSRLHLKNVR